MTSRHFDGVSASDGSWFYSPATGFLQKKEHHEHVILVRKNRCLNGWPDDRLVLV